MGGIWKRQITSARRVSGYQNRWQKFGCRGSENTDGRIEAVVNSRLVTVDTISDADSQMHISPSKILTRKSNAVMPPPENF